MAHPHNLVRTCTTVAAATFIALAAPVCAQDAPSTDTELERNLSVAQKPIFEIYQLQPVRHISIQASVDRSSLTYAIGEALRVLVRPLQDAYITVVDVGSSGRVALLYPNHFQSGTRVRAGTTLSIPTRSAHWEIKVSGPPGTDLIQVIASRRPLTLPELGQVVRTNADSPTVALGRSGEEFARDLIPQLKSRTASGSTPPTFGVNNLLIRVAG